MKIRVVLGVLCLAVIGCVGGSGGNPSLSNDRVATLSASEKLGNSGVTLDPPGLVAAKLDAQAAFAVCTSGRAPCPPTSPTTARLAIASDAGPGTADANGKVTLVMNKRLVWAISWSDIECRFRGGGLVDSSAQPVESAPSRCETVAFVDAGTGEFLYEVTYDRQ